MKNGDTVRDTITKFQGVVIAEHKYLNGCVRLSVQPIELKDGKPIDSIAFDIEQLELIEDAKPRAVVPKGGPQSEPLRQVAPAR